MLSADCINNGDIGITCSEDGVRADRHRNRHGHHRADDGSSGQGGTWGMSMQRYVYSPSKMSSCSPFCLRCRCTTRRQCFKGERLHVVLPESYLHRSPACLPLHLLVQTCIPLGTDVELVSMLHDHLHKAYQLTAKSLEKVRKCTNKSSTSSPLPPHRKVEDQREGEINLRLT